MCSNTSRHAMCELAFNKQANGVHLSYTTMPAALACTPTQRKTPKDPQVLVFFTLKECANHSVAIPCSVRATPSSDHDML